MTNYFTSDCSAVGYRRLLRCVAALALAAGVAGCHPASKPVILQQDYESLAGWLATEPAWLTTAMAHSGRYACFVDANSEYTPQYQATFEQIGKPRVLELRAWAWLPKGNLNLNLVLIIRRGQENLVWQALPITQAVRRYRQWELATRRIRLPLGLEPGDEVKLFVWQFGSVRDNVYLDDIALEKIR